MGGDGVDLDGHGAEVAVDEAVLALRLVLRHQLPQRSVRAAVVGAGAGRVAWVLGWGGDGGSGMLGRVCWYARLSWS